VTGNCQVTVPESMVAVPPVRLYSWGLWTLCQCEKYGMGGRFKGCVSTCC
jgi:hypothetical protein